MARGRQTGLAQLDYPDPTKGLRTAGWIALAVGGLTAIAGIALLIKGRKKGGGTAGLGDHLVATGVGGGHTSRLYRGAFPLKARIEKIKQQVYKSVRDPSMRQLALKVTHGCPERDQACEARAIYNYVKKNVRYTGDGGPIQFPDGTVEPIDIYQTAQYTLKVKGGDCDDQNILIGTLGALNGLEMWFRTVMYSEHNGHIYPYVKLKNGKGIVMDATLPGNGNFGVEAPTQGGKVQDFPA